MPLLSTGWFLKVGLSVGRLKILEFQNMAGGPREAFCSIGHAEDLSVPIKVLKLSPSLLYPAHTA